MSVRRLFERHYPRLVRFLYRRLGDPDRAEELAQEAFVRLLERRPRRPDAWLYAVAANLARDAARSDARRARRWTGSPSATAICSCSGRKGSGTARSRGRWAWRRPRSARSSRARRGACFVPSRPANDGRGDVKAGHHPSDGRLRAWLDGQLGLAPGLCVRAHVARCAGCRARTDRIRAEGRRAQALLETLSVAVDTQEAWARWRVRTAGVPRRRRVPAPTFAGAALAAAFIAIALWLGERRPSAGPPDLASGLPHLAVEPGREAGEGLLRWIAGWNGARVTRDVCCVDLDGGGRADDGLFTLSGPGERVAMVILYEDRDGRGALSATSLVRYVGRSP